MRLWKTNNGMPNEKDYKLLDNIEEDIMQELKDSDGYLNIGRQTTKGDRDIYFACKDFRKPSNVFFKILQNYSNAFEIEYDIYKDNTGSRLRDLKTTHEEGQLLT